MKKDTIQKTLGRIIPYVLFIILIPVSLIFFIGRKIIMLIRKIFQR